MRRRASAEEGFRALTLEDLITEAAARITRLEPEAAFSASLAGGLIVDIRSRDARQRNGFVPGSLHIPRTVLEWRVASDSRWRTPYVGGPDQQLILICDHGYSSILAADNLVKLGFGRTADVIGGFEAWKRAGLLVSPFVDAIRTTEGLPGMGPPD